MRWLSHWDGEDWLNLVLTALVMALVFGAIWVVTGMILERLG